MTSYILCCLLFTEFLLGSFHVIKSQSTTSEAAASVVSMASTAEPRSSSSSGTTAYQSIVMTSVSLTRLLSNNVTSSQNSIYNSSTAAANPTSSSSSTSRSPSEATTQPIFSTTGTTKITVPVQSSQNHTGVTTTTSDASPNATILSSTTITAVNTTATASSNGSSHTPTSVSVTTSSTVTQSSSSATHSTVATGNNNATPNASSTSHQTVSGTATTRVSNSTETANSTTRSASASTATTNATFTASQNMSTVATVTSTLTSSSTWFTVETISSSNSSTVTSQSTTDTVRSSSTDNYSTVGNVQTSATSSGGVPAWIAAPIICGVLLIVAAIVVVLLVLRCRRKKQRKSKFVSLERRQKEQPGGIMNPSFRIDSDDSERPPPAPVHVEDFVNHVAQLHRDSDYGFASEFAALNKMSPQNSKSAAELPENRTKNRFTNILPFDHSRVKLIPADDDENGGSDYINASFLPGFSSRREFIAAQGPMKSTVDDFWRMLWEYNVTTVVMVTNLFERGREKCVQYWPEQNEPVYYGDIQVELKSESSLNYYIIRVLNVTLEQKSRRVMHYQFLTWPDFGVPKEHSHLLSFLTQVRSSLHPTTNQPVLVHCSAGVGRTGTFILIDHVLQLIKRNSDIDLFGLVLDMRNYRSHMIQTEAQYIFAHECVRHAIELGYHEGRDIFTGSDDSSAGETQQESLYVNSGQGSN